MVGSRWRKHIFINDKPTDEQDFSGLHVTLLCGLEGLQPPPDPYALSLESSFIPEESRAIIKALVLTAINAKDRKSAFQAFKQDQEEGTSPELVKMYADTPNSKRCSEYLERKALWGQRNLTL